MTIQTLPPRLFLGRTAWIHTPSCIEVELELGFGVVIRRPMLLEGVSAQDIPARLRSEAKHCLVTLLGGKRVVVQTDPEQRGPNLVGRIFLNEKVKGTPQGMMIPYGFESPLLEVSTFYCWLATTGYDISRVKEVLNGCRREPVEVADGPA